MARLLNTLHDRSQATFTLLDVKEITGLEAGLANSLLHKAARHGLVSRIKAGVYTIIQPNWAALWKTWKPIPHR